MRLFLGICLVLGLCSPYNISHAISGGQPHWNTRASLIQLMAGTIGQRQIMLLGDSIIESYWWNTVGGVNVLNAGFSGIGIDALLAEADALLTIAKPRVVVVMVGINDCPIGNTTNPDEWWVKYSQLLDKIHAHNACPVVCTILPVEQGKVLGDQYFDQAKQAALNTKILYGATERGEEIVNLNAAFGIPPSYQYMKTGYSYDGVHPYGIGMSTLNHQLDPAIGAALSRMPQ